MLCKTKGDGRPSGKPRVYFTCHAADFERFFEKVCSDIFKTHDCAIYYTEDMNERIPQQDLITDLGSHNLVVVPVTSRLLLEPNRAMTQDIPYALSAHIPVLPLMMEPGLDEIYAREDKFGSLQYLNPFSCDLTEISYGEKLKKYLDSVLIGDETAKRIRAAFDAYIFLSYRKKDRSYANTLMEMIHRNPRYRDIAIWYDEFLNPGESFSENIRKILTDSKLFTLLVTPSLLEEPDGNPNFVMGVEYPAAKASGIGILPVQMQETEQTTLREKYRDLPKCVDLSDEKAFWDRLLTAMEQVAVKTHAGEPEHTYLMGLAYLEGFDVEVNRQRGLELITAAADENLPEAMEKLCAMYETGQGVPFDLPQACRWAEKLVAFSEKTYGTEDPATAIAWSELARLYQITGAFKAAERLWRKAVAWAIKHLTDTDPLVIQWAANLQFVYRSMGLYDIANRWARWAYQQAGARFEKTDTEYLQAQQNLAISCWDQGQLQKAIPLQETVCRHIREVHGWKSPAYIAAQMTLSTLYVENKDFSKAWEIIAEAMEIAEGLWQENDPNMLMLQNALSVIYIHLGDREKACGFNEKVLTMAPKTFGQDHPMSLYAIGNLAMLHKKRGDFTQALQLEKKLYFGLRRVFGLYHPETLAAEYNMAQTYFELRDYPKAKARLENVHLLYQAAFGKEHPKTLAALWALAVCSDRLLDHQKATTLGEEAYGLSAKLLGENHPETLDKLHQLARFYRTFGNDKRAFECFEKAYRKRAAVLGEDHPDTRKSYRNMQKTGKALEGLPMERRIALQKESLALFRQWEQCRQEADNKKRLVANRALYGCYCELMGDAHPRVIQLMKEQLELYEALGMYMEAINTGLEAYENFSDAWGESYPDVQEILEKLLSLSQKLESQ